MAPRVGIAAHHQANLAVELLLDPEKAVENLPEIMD
jgi:sulfur carrier protein ThiS adenylyltransferase